MYRFSAASSTEPVVFGAARPGYAAKPVRQWLEFMQKQQIQRVCCLLAPQQIDRYSGLLETYQETFGAHQVCWAPIEDFQLAKPQVLVQVILPFLVESDKQRVPVVVHCSGGVGRTGQVLAAWLVHARGFSNEQAIATVRQRGRNPYEAAIAAAFRGQNPWNVARALHELLDVCRSAGAEVGQS